MTKDIHEPMSDEEAQQEFNDIQAEIAKEKGLPEEKSPEEKAEKEEPRDKETEESEEKSDDPEETQTEEDEPAIEPERTRKGDRDKVPLSKYQDTKKTLESQNASLQSKVAELTEELNRAKTTQKVGDKVKAFAEKHGMAEDTVLDLVQLVQGENELDQGTKDIIKKSEVALKKQEAEEKFSQELADFIADVPDAKGYEQDLRAQAFKEGNLDKSLFEIFHRFVKTDEAPKRKTGEATRGATRQTTTKFDPVKTADDIENGKVSIKNLTEAQVDEVFAYMEKTGSRYIGKK